MPSVWHTLRSSLVREQTIFVALVFAYVVTGHLGLQLAYTHPAVSLVWPPSGIALGAVLVLGYRMWPAVLIGAVVLYSATIGPEPAVLAMGAANTLECVLSAYLINRFACGRQALQTPQTALRFAGLTALAAATIGASISTVSLVVSGVAPAHLARAIWMSWALGSFAGTLLVAPIVILFIQGSTPRIPPRQALEGVAVFAGVLVIGLAVFCGIPAGLRDYPVDLLCVPVLLWAAFRLGRRPAAVALLLMSSLAVYGTLNGEGPFFQRTPTDSVMMVMAFMSLTAVMTLALAALAAEYAVADAQLRELVVTDPLTGLPNHRRLLEVLSAEIARSNRHDRGFAVVFFDMDNMKRVNDDYGHVMGSRALCRFAETLRAVCRETDTPARYGGDEFVAVLPDTGEDGARLVVRRVHERLEEDQDKPQLATSAGIALYPRDGGTPTTLLAAADRALYNDKAEKANARRRGVVPFREWTKIGTGV
jgi:diguanylate cyclase (GGDEF)-like protein